MKKQKFEKIYVAIPFYSVTADFNILIEEGWSYIDNIFLKYIADCPRSMEDLVLSSNLPRQLIIQIIIPMVKMGWIELLHIPERSCYAFTATRSGKKVSEDAKLPTVKNNYSRKRDYLFEPFSAKCFESLPYGSPIRLESRARVLELTRQKKISMIDFPEFSYIFPKDQDIFNSVKKGTEQVIGFEKKSSFSLNDKKEEKFIVVVLIRHNNGRYRVDGADLKSWLGNYCFFIEEKVNDSDTSRKIIEPKQKKYFFQDSNLELLNDQIFVDREKIGFLYGGNANKDALISGIKKANSYLIIHTTFIGEWILKKEGFIMDELKDAAKRGVYILIMWGKDDFYKIKESELERMKKVEQFLDTVNQELKNDGFESTINLNEPRTGSHAKYFLYDTVENESFSLVGSCNFLFSNFDRFEASVLIDNAALSLKLLEITVSLSVGRNGVSSRSNDTNFRRISDTIKNKILNSRIESRGENHNFYRVNLILKGEHYPILERAKNNANKKIFICSDKINPTLYRPIWDCLKSKRDGCNVEAFYSNPSEGYTHTEISDLSGLARTQLNLTIKKHAPPHGRTNHSKVLCWDKNNILITSLNWFSSNASCINTIQDSYHEIGIFIEGENVTDQFHSDWARLSKLQT